MRRQLYLVRCGHDAGVDIWGIDSTTATSSQLPATVTACGVCIPHPRPHPRPIPDPNGKWSPRRTGAASKGHSGSGSVRSISDHPSPRVARTGRHVIRGPPLHPPRPPGRRQIRQFRPPDVPTKWHSLTRKRPAGGAPTHKGLGCVGPQIGRRVRKQIVHRRSPLPCEARSERHFRRFVWHQTPPPQFYFNGLFLQQNFTFLTPKSSGV
jgi:hypothetical protein